LLQRERNEKLMLRWIDIWRRQRMFFRVWKAWLRYHQQKNDERKSIEFCRKFYMKGLEFRAIRSWKLFCQVAGNRMYMRRVKQRIEMEVEAEV